MKNYKLKLIVKLRLHNICVQNFGNLAAKIKATKRKTKSLLKSYAQLFYLTF